MPWFRVDDGFWGHSKRWRCSLTAIGLWSVAGSWSAQQLTDGKIPRHVLSVFGGKPKDAAELVEADLWIETDEGWLFKDWHLYQRTRAEVEADREAARKRMNKARNGRRITDDGSAEVRANTDGTSDGVTLTQSLPSPTQPVLGTSVGTESGGSVETAEPPHFCFKHPGGADGPCGGCADARRIWQAWDVARMKREDAERVAVAAYNCSRCEGTGFIEDPITHDPIDKCNHLRSVS